MRLVERAKALLVRAAPGASLGELHERASRLLLEQLEKQKFCDDRSAAKCEAESDRKGEATARSGAERRVSAAEMFPRRCGAIVDGAVKCDQVSEGAAAGERER